MNRERGIGIPGSGLRTSPSEKTKACFAIPFSDVFARKRKILCTLNFAHAKAIGKIYLLKRISSRLLDVAWILIG